jgi:hypothetical protein
MSFEELDGTASDLMIAHAKILTDAASLVNGAANSTAGLA